MKCSLVNKHNTNLYASRIIGRVNIYFKYELIEKNMFWNAVSHRLQKIIRLYVTDWQYELNMNEIVA